MTNGCRRRRLRCRHPRAPLSEGGSGGDGRCQRSWCRHPTVRSAHHRSRRLEHHWASARAPLSESEGGWGSRLRSERRGPCSYEGVLCCPDWCLFINACPSDRMLPKRRVGCGIKPTSVQFEAQPQTSISQRCPTTLACATFATRRKKVMLMQTDPGPWLGRPARPVGFRPAGACNNPPGFCCATRRWVLVSFLAVSLWRRFRSLSRPGRVQAAGRPSH